MTTMTTVNVGDKVTFRHEKWGGTLTGKVVDVSPTKATVAVRRTAGNWSIPHGHFRISIERLTVVPLIDPRNHSAKGLDTFSEMGTKPADWGLAQIKWEKRVLDTEVWVLCDTCAGAGMVGTLKGKTVPQHEAWNGGAIATLRACPTCPRVRWTRQGRTYYAKDAKVYLEDGRTGHHGSPERRSTHEMNGLVEATLPLEREVGVVQWAKDTLFDSRFTEWSHCQLCAKDIPSHRFVPVTGKGEDGRIHGMWVGEDCARKFLGIKNFKENQTVERPT